MIAVNFSDCAATVKLGRSEYFYTDDNPEEIKTLPNTNYKLLIHVSWIKAILAGVAIQITLTLLIPSQKWSMPIGLSYIILCCAAMVSKSKVAKKMADWRYNLAIIGFLLWSATFLAVAYQNNILGRAEPYSGIFSALKQCCFILILLPVSDKELNKNVVYIDIIFALLFSISLALRAWGAIFNDLSNGPSVAFIIFGYTVLPLLGLASYFSQRDAVSRVFIRELCQLFMIYGIICYICVVLDNILIISKNSPIWIIGDITFIIFAFRLQIQSKSIEIIASEVEPIASGHNRHWAPTILMLILLLLTFQICTQSFLLGVTIAALGLVAYALRTAIILNIYLADKNNIIVAEQRHTRLLVDMIHDIRSPLGSVVLNAGMLQHQIGSSEQQSRWLEQVGVGCERVTNMLNDVLELERIDAGLVAANCAHYVAMEIVEAAVAVVNIQATAANISVETEGDAAAIVFADQKMLERVLINILTNSVRFSEVGGRIAVSVSLSAEDSMYIRVRDYGAGIAPAILPTLFQRFSNVGAPQRGCRGSGLGLSICHELVKIMKGSLNIESWIELGTLVTIRLPCASNRRIGWN